MLEQLHITNYALIERLDISFDEGFSVITGETGAGKSIILGAMGLLLGQRADTKYIKQGASKCCVEGIFATDNPDLRAFFEENDIDFDGKECIVRREITAAGKSRAFVNDTPVSLAKLKEVSSFLIDIHSQHQNLLVGHETFLLGILDMIAGNASMTDDFRLKFDRWRKAGRELDLLYEQAKQDQSETDYLQFQLKQLEEADLQEGEQEELEQEADTLSHAEEIKSALYQVSSAISSDGQDMTGQLRQSGQQLRSISGIYPLAESLAERLESVRIELEDISQELEGASEHIEFNPERLVFIEDRLDVIYGLEKKHHVSGISELLLVESQLRERLERIENIDDLVRQKEEEVSRLYESLLKAGNSLTESRQRAADHVVREITETLQNLGMPNIQLRFELAARAQPDTTGMDSVTLLFSSNRNVPMQDVSQIASGGEIARLMLSLKALLSIHRNLPTIIFDEIDTGVSGTMAERMAIVMQQMSDRCQVICITHLPQIAACGKNHYRVYKSESEAGTASHIVLLTKEERITEIANMLSGAELTEAAINNARSLLKL